MAIRRTRVERAEIRNTLSYFKRYDPTATCIRVSVVTEKMIYIRYKRLDLNANGLFAISRERTRRLQT